MQSISGFSQELWTVSGRILQGSCREFREGSGKVPHRKVGLKVTERLRKLRESSGKGADALGRAPGRFCRGSGQDGGCFLSGERPSGPTKLHTKELRNESN